MAKDEETRTGEESRSFDAAIKEALRRGLSQQTAAAGAEGEGARARVMKKEDRLSIWRRQVGGVIGSVPRRQVYAFCQQLALLLECGMPLVKGLNTLANRSENLAFSRAIRNVGNAVEEGSTFSDAIAEHGKYFPPLVISMFRAGEQSGDLTATLNRVAEQGERLAAVKHKTLAQLVYPIFVLLAAFVVVGFILGFALQRFGEIFLSFEVETPATMRFLLWLGALLRNGTFWVTLIVAVVALVVIWKILVRMREFRHLRDRFVLIVPGLRHLSRESNIAQFARVFSTMLGSGVPLQQSLQACYDTSRNECLREAIQRVQEDVRQGGRVTPGLEGSNCFPPLAYDLSAVGEEAGALDRVYARMADVYEEKFETDIATLSKLLQPIIIFVLAVFVGFILISFIQTYAQLWQAAMSAAPR